VRLKHILPLRGEDLKVDIERALRAEKGVTYRDRETGYILLMKSLSMKWDEMMNMPYRILLKMNLMNKIDSLLRKV